MITMKELKLVFGEIAILNHNEMKIELKVNSYYL